LAENGEVVTRQYSRQRMYQLKRISEGNCQWCGKPRATSKCACEECLKRNRERNRTRKGQSAWAPGGIGRPPLWWIQEQKEKNNVRSEEAPENT
jgi:hypothetical protein